MRNIDPETLDLYRHAYPDLIAIFWAYCKLRFQDGVPVFQTEYDEYILRIIRDCEYVDMELNIRLRDTFTKLLEEFYVIMNDSPVSFKGTPRYYLLSNDKFEKYRYFLQSPFARRTQELVMKYINNDKTKLPGVVDTFGTQAHWEILDHGAHSGADAGLWGGVMSYGIREAFNIHKFLLISTSVDLRRFGQYSLDTGIVPRSDDDTTRVPQILDDNFAGFVDPVIARTYRKEDTMNCPASLPSSNKVHELIQTHFPELDPTETMTDGIGRVIPAEISNLFNEYIRRNGENAFLELANRQQDHVRMLMLSGFYKDKEVQENSKFSNR